MIFNKVTLMSVSFGFGDITVKIFFAKNRHRKTWKDPMNRCSKEVRNNYRI